MRRMIPIFAVILVLAAAWIAWPFWTAHRIVRAVETQDTAALTPLVDWPELRDGLKGDLTRRAKDEMTRGDLGQGALGQVLASGLGGLLAPTLVEALVDNLVTPEGLTQLVQLGRDGAQILRPQGGGQGSGNQKEGSHDRAGKLKLGGAWFTTPTRFRFSLSHEDKPDQPGPTVVLAFEQFGWKLVRLNLP
jgi:hypothetical protein